MHSRRAATQLPSRQDALSDSECLKEGRVANVLAASMFNTIRPGQVFLAYVLFRRCLFARLASLAWSGCTECGPPRSGLPSLVPRPSTRWGERALG